MMKKIFFSLIVFSTLFIGQRAFAVFYPYTTTGTASLDTAGNYSVTGISSVNWAHLGLFTTPNIDNYAGQHFFEALPNTTSGNLFNTNLPNVHLNDYIPTPDGFYWGLTICSGGSYTINDCTNPVFFKALSTNTISDISGSVSPLASDISDILLPDNTSLDEVIEPISAPAGLNVYFTNYEINPYQYLHINLITCTNGQNEGCNGYNQTERFFNIDISNLGYSEDKEDLLLYRFNLQGLVTQNDYVSVSYKLSNCDYNISVCPEGYSAGRSYQFIVNNALTEGTWVDFEDENRPECTFARLDVCFMNAMRWLFLPSPKLLSDITSITFSDRIPFSYIYDLDDLYKEAFNDTPKDINISIPFGSFGNITLLSTEKLEAIQFQGTVRTVMGAILIFGTVMLIYRKVLTINDRREVVEKQ